LEACDFGYADVVALLLAAGADMQVQDKVSVRKFAFLGGKYMINGARWSCSVS
jgi:hypothetical protein